MTSEERADLRALCERATAGPWEVHDYGRYWLVNNDEWGVEVPGFAGEANARFIAAARTALPRLLDALERSERARERLGDLVRAAIKAGDWKVDGACDPDLSGAS